MAFIIIGDSFTFPEGDAATNRVYTYAKGFTEHGINVHIIGLRNDYLEKHSGETEGIKYYHPFNQSVRNPHFLFRRWQNILKYHNTIKLFRRLNKEDKIHQIIVYTIRLNTHIFAFILAKLFASRLILERSEHPLKGYKSKTGEKIVGSIKVAIEIRLSDNIFCISDYLMDFYRNRGAGNDKLFKVPSTVDDSRFNQYFEKPVGLKYICYCGSLTKLKDGVDILIKSFAIIASIFQNINLLLVGKADTIEDEIYFRDLVSDLDVNNRIIFTGKLSRNAIPAYLCNAEILVMARPRSIVADAGFPSKLTEYLSTGKPVVATKVGEIPEYLTDNENVFLAEPDSVEAFAEKLQFVLTNYHLALAAGMRGKELTSTIFNYNYQAKKILSFLDAQ